MSAFSFGTFPGQPASNPGFDPDDLCREPAGGREIATPDQQALYNRLVGQGVDPAEADRRSRAAAGDPAGPADGRPRKMFTQAGRAAGPGL